MVGNLSIDHFVLVLVWCSIVSISTADQDTAAHACIGSLGSFCGLASRRISSWPLQEMEWKRLDSPIRICRGGHFSN